MNTVIGTFRIGEEIVVALDATTGDLATVTGIAAKIKPAQIAANRIVLDDTAVGTDMLINPQGAAGWLISLGHMSTANMPAGLYGIDAKLSFAGSVEITDQTAFIALTKAAVA